MGSHETWECGLYLRTELLKVHAQIENTLSTYSSPAPNFLPCSTEANRMEYNARHQQVYRQQNQRRQRLIPSVRDPEPPNFRVSKSSQMTISKKLSGAFRRETFLPFISKLMPEITCFPTDHLSAEWECEGLNKT